MAKRLINTEITSNNYKYRLEVVDLLGSGLNLDHSVEISVPGPKISYDGNINNHTSSVMGSSMEFTAFMNLNQRNDVMNIMYSNKEYALAVGYYLYDEDDNEHLEWCGLVLPDGTTETVESSGGYVTVTFQCTDGLPTLNHTNFVTPDTGEFYSGERSLSFWIREALKKLPHWNYYFSAQTQTYMKEVGSPIPTDDTYTFDDQKSSLDASYVHARTFYGSKKSLNTKRRMPVSSDSFSSTYNVLDDILLAMGCSIVLTKGCWYVINRSYFALEIAASNNGDADVFFHSNISSPPYYEVSEGTESFIIDVGSRTKNHVVSGATRTGLFPFKGATMTHDNSGSDLIFARGVGYNGFDGLDITTNQPMYSVVDQDWSNNNGYYMYDIGTSENQSNITEINVPSGSDGMITIAMSGFFSMDKKLNMQSQSTARHGVGSCPIIRNVIKITDTSGKSWRLKRHVLTLNSFKSSINVSDFMETFGYPLGLGQDEYFPKYYENGGAYDWIGDDETEYNTTYFETMIGMDPDIVLEGATERFLEVDYLNTKFYTPIKTEVKENNEGTDNVLSVRHNDDRCRYLWRLNYNLEMPVLPTGYVSGFNWESHQLLVFSPENGPRPTGDGTYTVDQAAAFFTSTNIQNGATSDTSYEPIEYIVYGCSVKVGDGTETSDLQYLSFDSNNNGSEVHSLGETRIGSSYTNRFYGSNGKIRASLYDNGLQLTSREDNLYWSPRYDITESEEALLYLNCSEVMQTRYKTRQVVSMSIINASGLYNEFIRPVNLVRTDILGVGGEEVLMPISLNKDAENISAEFIVVGFERDAILEAQDANGKGPHDTENPSGPGITDGSGDGTTAISNVKSLLATSKQQATVNMSDTELFTIFFEK